MKIKLKIERWGKQNCDLDLEAILDKVAISTSMLEIEPALKPKIIPNLGLRPKLI